MSRVKDQTQQPTVSQLKEVLAATGNARIGRQVHVLEHPGLLKPRRKAETAIRSLFVDAGVNVDEVEKSQAQYRSELNRVAEEQRRVVVGQSSESQGAVNAKLNSWRKFVDSGRIYPAGIKPELGPTILDKPFLILPTSAIVTGEHIGPGNSWAKTQVVLRKSGDVEIKEEAVSFYYLWTNPHSHGVTLDVTTALGFNGYCRVHAEGSFYNSAYSHLEVFCALAIRPWSQAPSYVLGSVEDVIDLDARSISLLDDDSAARVVSTQVLKSSSHSWVTIGANELVVFEVVAVFHAHVEAHGSALVDFDSGNFAISSPGLALGVWIP